MRLIDALKRIKTDGPVHADVGICVNVAKTVSWCAADQLKPLLAKWPHVYTDEGGYAWGEYPVGGYTEYTIGKIDGTLWDNPRRWQLLDWLIEQLEAEETVSELLQKSIDKRREQQDVVEKS